MVTCWQKVWGGLIPTYKGGLGRTECASFAHSAEKITGSPKGKAFLFVGRIPQLNPAWVYCSHISRLKNAIWPTSYVRRGLAPSAKIIIVVGQVAGFNLTSQAFSNATLSLSRCKPPHRRRPSSKIEPGSLTNCRLPRH